MHKVFISYRRDDSAAYAGRLYDRLAAHFGAGQVFMDIDQIEPGEDFVEVIKEKVGLCSAAIVLIGKSWLSAADAQGNRRLDDPEDFVRQEITTALGRKIRVFPVLVGGSVMPKMAQLPEALAALSRRNAIEVTDLRFHHDVDRLIEALEKTLEPRPASPSATVANSDASSAPNTGTASKESTLKNPANQHIAMSSESGSRAANVEEIARRSASREEKNEFSSSRQPNAILSASRNKQLIAGAILVVLLAISIVIVRYQSRDSSAPLPDSETKISDVKGSDSAPTSVENIVRQTSEVKLPEFSNPTGASPSARARASLDSATSNYRDNETKKRTVSLSSGTADELYETGIMYEFGAGADKDLNQAAKWYAAAAAKGHRDARLALDDVNAEIAEAGRPANYNADSPDQLKKDIERLGRQQARSKIVLDKNDQAARDAIKRIKGG